MDNRKIQYDFDKACVVGNLKLVKELVDKVSDKSIGLKYSYLANKMDVFRFLLLDKNIDIYYVFDYLCIDNNLDMLDNLEYRVKKSERNLLYVACTAGDIVTVKKIIDFYDINYVMLENTANGHYNQTISKLIFYKYYKYEDAIKYKDIFMRIAALVGDFKIFKDLVEEIGIYEGFNCRRLVEYNRIEIIKYILDLRLDFRFEQEIYKAAVWYGNIEIIDIVLPFVKTDIIFIGLQPGYSYNIGFLKSASYLFGKGYIPEYKYRDEFTVLLEGGIPIETFKNNPQYNKLINIKKRHIDATNEVLLQFLGKDITTLLNKFQLW